MNKFFSAFREAVETMGITAALAGLALFAALAQAASSDRLSVRDFMIGAPMSGFVIWMAWLWLSGSGLSEPMRVFWAGVAAFGAQWILRGINTLLSDFSKDPIGTLVRIKELWRKQ